MKRRTWLLTLMACCVCTLLAAACGGSTGPTGPNPKDVATQVAKGVASASTLHLKGKLNPGSALDVDVTLSPDTDGDATVSATTSGGVPITIVVVKGATYVQAPQYWSSVVSDDGEARALGSKWVRMRVDDAEYGAGELVPLVPTLRRLASLRAPGSTKLMGTFKLGRTLKVDGKKALELKSEGMTYDVTATKPYRLLKVIGDQPKIDHLRVSGVQLDADYDAQLSATAPAQFLDIQDKSTWPARYDVPSDADTDGCDQDSCTLKVSVTNNAGAPEGQSTVTITASTPDGAPIANCQAPIPAIASGASQDVSCVISGGAWTDFVNNNAPEGGFAQFATDVSLHNPPYDA